MATEVGHAYVTIIPSLKGFTSATQTALARENLGGRVGEEMGRGSASSGRQAGSLFGREFSGAVSKTSLNVPNLYVAGFIRNLRTYGYALSGVGALTVGFGLRTASSMEQAQVAFTTMLGSARQAQTFLASLVTFAQRTPFDLPGVVQASQRLLAYGFSAKQVLPTLTAIGDATAGLGGSAGVLSEITTAIGQISAKGTVQAQEVLQLTNAGVPALRILANQFGITQAKLQDYMQRGLIPASRAIPALLAGLEHGTNGLAGSTAKFGGLMSAQSHTLGGIFSNLRDTVSQGLARAVGPLVPVLEQQIPRAMNRLPGLFSAAARGMRDFLTGLGLIADQTPGAASGLEQFGSIVRTTGKVLSSVFGFISDHATLFKILGIDLLGAVVGVKAFSAAMWILDAATTANPVGLIVAGVGALAAGFIYAWKTSETFRNVLTGVFVFVGQTVVSLGQTMFDALTLPLRAVLIVAAKIPSPVQGAAKSALHALRTVDHGLESTNAWLDRLTKPRAVQITFTSSFVGPLAPNEKRAGPVKLPSGFMGPLAPGESRAPITKAVTDTTKSITDAFGSLPPLVDKKAKAAIPKVQQSAQQIADAILGPLRDLKQRAADLAKGIVDAITGSTGLGSLTTRTDIMGNQTRQSLSGLIRGLTEQRQAVLNFRRELRTLSHRGLSGTDVNTIAALGLDQGGGLAQTLMGATGAQLRNISSLTSGISGGAALIGTDRTQATYGAQIGAEIARERVALEKKLSDTSLSKKTVHDLESAFKTAVSGVKQYVSIVEIDHKQGRRALTALARG